MMDTTLRQAYYDPSSPGGLGGIKKLYVSVKDSDGVPPKLSDIKNWLEGEDAYTLHVPAAKHFPRNRVLVNGIDVQFQADLVDMTPYSEENDGTRFLLTCIDVFSKYAWVRPLSSKTARCVTDAFKDILCQGRIPRKIQTDEGKEFYNKAFQEMIQQYDIKHFSTANETKCSIIERWNRTLKTIMWRYLTAANSRRYIDSLQDMVDGYNRTWHRSIKFAPADVDKSNENIVFNNLYKTKPVKFPVFKYSVGDTVRISKYRGIFRKGYEQTFTDEIFTITQCIGRTPVVYRLKDFAEEAIKGTFYEKEIQRVRVGNNKVYKIEEILESRKRGGKKYVYVKWLGWPQKFNSWIPEDDISSV